MPTSDRVGLCALILAACLALPGCRAEPDNRILADAEARQVSDAAEAGRISCALAGARLFRLDCTVDRIASSDGEILVVGRADAGYRRLRITRDGRGVIAADGAEEAHVAILDDTMVEVTIAQDRYRLPAHVAAR